MMGTLSSYHMHGGIKLSLEQISLTITLEDIRSKLKLNITPNRYKHSENVMEVAVKLAKKYGVNVNKAAIAGILHDCARSKSEKELYELCDKFGIELDEIKRRQPALLHGYVGEFIAKIDYGIEDKEILNAIRVHTTGKENMSIFEKIILIADYIEPERNFPGVEVIRELAYKDIDNSIVQAFDTTIKYIIKVGGLIHPDTIKARNYFLL